MAEKKIQARIRQKVDTKANWDKATNFVPLKGEYIYYSDLHKVKVGDGTTKVGALPFLEDNDSKVTSAANHYTPTTDSSAQLSVDASSTTAATWNSTQLVTGVNLQRDAKGHVTGMTVDSIKMPANPDTHFTTGLYVGKADEKSNSATTNGNTYLKLFDNDTKRSQHLINGGGATMVTSNASGTIEIATPIKTLDTTSSSKVGDGSSENIAGSGTIYLHKVAKTGKLTDLSDRTFSNISSRGDEYLEWGGPAKSGDVSPIGVAMSLEHSANRLALINHDALTFEYSSDGGTTWTAYSYKGTEKTKFCTSYLGLPIGRPDENTNLVANKSKTRITITAQNGTSGYVYVSLRKLLVNVASATTLSMLLERRTGANYKSNGAWETIGTYSLKGWSGWNDIPLSSHLGGGNTQTSNYWQMRMTITCTTVSTTSPKTGQVRGIRIFGENCWIPASTLAETGHLYSYNMDGHATFPNNVYAHGFYATGTISTTDGSVSGLSFIEGGKKLSEKYLGISAKAADSLKLDGHSSSYYLNTNTEQFITGKKCFETDLNFGKWVNPIRQVSDAPANLHLMNSAQTTGVFFDTVILAGAGDWLYLGHLKPDFSIRASFRGTGDENDTYSANLEYTHGTLNTLTDWDYQSGWCVRPTKVSTTTPAIIQIKFTRQLYTDVLRLIITGHNLNDRGGDYSGFLDDYTIEVCTNYTDDTWTTVVNRTNASDSIGAGLMYSLQTGSYTSCYGIRLKITKCHVTGTGYAFIKISSMQLRDYRPGIKFPDCLGAISQGGGDVWGELYTKSNLVTHNVLPYATNESYLGNSNSQYWSVYSHDFYENGTALSDKYLAKGSASTNDNQVIYNPVELKKGLTGTGALVWNGNYVDTFKLNILSSGSAEEAFTYSQLSASLKCRSLTLKSTSGGSNMVLDPSTGGSITITGGSKDKYFSFASATEGTFLTTGDKGIADGVASLGSDGKVPASQLAVGSISSESIVSICI